MIETWAALIETFGRRLGMWVGHPTFSRVRSFVQGFGVARNDDVLDGFQQWLSGQPQHDAIKNFAWHSLILHEVFPDRDRPASPQWLAGSRSDALAWPLPPPTPVREDDLAYPADDAIAIDHLFARLREYLDRSRQG